MVHFCATQSSEKIKVAQLVVFIRQTRHSKLQLATGQLVTDPDNFGRYQADKPEAVSLTSRSQHFVWEIVQESQRPREMV